jgi:hypothetical protein
LFELEATRRRKTVVELEAALKDELRASGKLNQQ